MIETIGLVSAIEAADAVMSAEGNLYNPAIFSDSPDWAVRFPRMDDVAGVEVDALPVDETLAGPSTGETQSVVLEDGPGAAVGDAAGAGVETDGDAFVGEVRAGGDGVEGVAGQFRSGGAAVEYDAQRRDPCHCRAGRKPGCFPVDAHNA